MNDFTIASPDERTLSVGEYVVGIVLLAAMLAPIAWAAWRLRAALFPDWTGAPARVVEIVLGLSGLLLIAQVVGTVGIFGAASMTLGALALAIAAAFGSRKFDGLGLFGRGGSLREAELSGRKSQETPSPSAAAIGSTPSPRVAVAVAGVACAALAAAWAVPTLISVAGGMGRADTLWYHMPLSMRFIQTGSLAEIFHFDPIFLAAYYPASSSVFHAIPILAFDRDFLSPLLNVGFLGVGLLSAWAIGRPYGLGPHALVGGSIALGAQMLVEFQGGQALNDIVGTVLILAAVAVLVNTSATSSAPAMKLWAAATPRTSDPAPASGGGGLLPEGILVAGLAAGLAAGMKLSFLAPVVALLVGLIVLAGRGERVRAFGWFAVPALLTGGYWYLRNLVAVGNPVPAISSIGPIELPGPERVFQLRPGFSVAHYWNEPGVWVDWFFPGLEESFGALWLLTLLAIAAAGVYALWQRSEPLLRALGAVVLVTSAAYLVTPLTAAGEEGEPISFVWNVRYMAPAAAVGLAILPCLPVLRATPWRRAATLVVLAALLAVTIGSLVQWQQGHTKGAIAAGLATLALFALGAWLISTGTMRGATSQRWIAGLGVAVVLGAVGAGWVLQDHYLERRYQNLSPGLKLAEAVRFGGDLRDARVAISGVRGVFNQYPFYGADLSNRVQWLGIEADDGGFVRIPTCARWREELAAGGYTHVVTMYDPFGPGPLPDTKEALWTRQDPAARQVLREGPVSVFELTGEPDPDACGDLPDLTEPELNGDSVNLVPEANDPAFRN